MAALAKDYEVGVATSGAASIVRPVRGAPGMTADASEPRKAVPVAPWPESRTEGQQPPLPAASWQGGSTPSPGSVSAWPFQGCRAGAFRRAGASSMVDSKAAPASVLPLNGSLTTGTC